MENEEGIIEISDSEDESSDSTNTDRDSVLGILGDIEGDDSSEDDLDNISNVDEEDHHNLSDLNSDNEDDHNVIEGEDDDNHINAAEDNSELSNEQEHEGEASPTKDNNGVEDSSSNEEFFPVDHNQQSQPNFIFQTVYSGILQGVSTKDLEKVRDMVKNGFSVNINDNGGNTPLHLAVAFNVPEIMDFLLEQEEIVVNARNFSGATPLLCAIEQGNELLVKKLLKAGASVNLTNLHEIGPLHLSVKHPNICHLLILNGANLNAQDYGGETPLHEAVDQNNIETICMLLYYDANANVQCHNGLTPFMKAIYERKTDIQYLLLDYVNDFNAVAADGMSLLGFALRYDSPCKVEIIKRGGDVNYQHPTYNIFDIFCQNPAKKIFPLIWDHFKHKELRGQYYWTNLCDLDLQLECPVFLKTVVKSGNVKPFLDSSKIPSFSFLTDIGCNFREWEETVTKLILIFLCEGGELNSGHLCDVYRAFGYCELFEMLLFQDFYFIPDHYGFPNLIFDFRTPANINIRLFLVHDLVPFFQHHRPSNPSLLELAKTKTRQHILNKFNIHSSREFYTCIKRLPIRQVYKDILTYKKPIYVHTDPDYPLNELRSNNGASEVLLRPLHNN